AARQEPRPPDGIHVTLLTMPTSRARSQSLPVATSVQPSSSPTAQHAIPALAVFTALVASGSCGLIGHPLRHGLSLAGLLSITAASLGARPSLRGVAQIALFSVLAAYLSTSSSNMVSVLSVVVLLGGITLSLPEFLPALRPVSFAIFVLALYR